MPLSARTSWKGFLKLSLISVPVKAYTANDSDAEIHLNQLHKDCNSRIRYQKVCPEHGELRSEQIVSGYEHQKGSYVVVDPDEVDRLRTKADRAVNIDGFLPLDSIDAVYHAGKTHFLLPDGVVGERPYALLHQGMVQNKVGAIAQVVMAGREQLVLLRPMGRLLVLTVLHYPQRLRAADDFAGELDDIQCKPEELALTNTLIQASTLRGFEPARYRDQYLVKLRQLIQLKIDGQAVVAAPDHEEPRILNLMDALKQSVAEAQLRLAAGVETTTPPAGGADDSPGAPAAKLAPSAGKQKQRRAERS